MSKTAKTYHTLRIDLKYTQPPIWRRLRVPSVYTLGDLSAIIQTAFEWLGGHMHAFEQEIEPDPGADPDRFDTDEEQLEAMFRIRGCRQFGRRGGMTGMDDVLDEESYRLCDVCPNVGDKLTFIYDFGDNWEHVIKVEKIEEAGKEKLVPSCLGGRKAAPPDDCGGVPGYEYLLEVLADPNHPEHEDMKEWLGYEIDPDDFDRDEVNAMIRASLGEGKR